MAERPSRKIDWMTFSLFLSLVGIGWLMIYTVGYGEEYQKGINHFIFNTDVGKQTLWILVCMFTFFFIFIIDRKFWQTFAYPIYIFSLLLLVAVLFLGKEIKGATAWFVFGGASFQPSELAKFGTAIAMASYLNTYSTNLKQFRHQLASVGFIAVPLLLILAQPDAGSALVFLSFFIMLFREGFPANFFIFGFSAITLLLLGFLFDATALSTALVLLGMLPFLFTFERKTYWLAGWLALSAGIWFLYDGQFKWVFLGLAGGLWLILGIRHLLKKDPRLVVLVLSGIVLSSALVFASGFAFNNILKPHQQDRINVWLNPGKCDPQGSLYNVLQSKMAIGSGGLNGKGFLKGSLTKGNFVPEQSTDFIFCTIGEEQGFIGSVAIIGLFLLLLMRIITIAERQRSNFARAYAYGVAGILFVHIFINIAMTMGLMPIIGIPLPFISKGGSSLFGFTILLSLLLKLDQHRYQL
jgi:rod shape determining protein RodA